MQSRVLTTKRRKIFQRILQRGSRRCMRRTRRDSQDDSRPLKAIRSYFGRLITKGLASSRLGLPFIKNFLRLTFYKYMPMVNFDFSEARNGGYMADAIIDGTAGCK